MKRLRLLAGLVVALVGCTHRPYLRELPASSADGFAMKVVDPETGAPLEGVTVKMGEGKARVSLKSDAAGVVQVPASPALWSANPLVEVNRTTGGGYRLVAAEGGR